MKKKPDLSSFLDGATEESKNPSAVEVIIEKKKRGPARRTKTTKAC